MQEPLDLDRARLLLIWLQARRALDIELSDLLAAGPAGERRVRARIDRIETLVTAAHQTFAAYAESARSAGPSSRPMGRLAALRPEARA